MMSAVPVQCSGTAEVLGSNPIQVPVHCAGFADVMGSNPVQA